jgi:hypothetical protein
MRVRNYKDFVRVLRQSGFSLGGGNSEGIYAVVDFGWRDTPPGSPVVWHTGDPETDPWEWRIRVLNERGDIAYAKCFFKKSGYITQEFYPYFLALRRGGRTFAGCYADGLLSNNAKRIYSLVCEHDELPLHEIKHLGGFGREDKSKFNTALTELQMGLWLTICGTQRRVNALGGEYGWETTAFCTPERFWEGTDVFPRASALTESAAYEAIRRRVLRLNPAADEKTLRKFAFGK